MYRRTDNQRRKQGGFSIIELLVAIIIITILAVILIPIIANRTEQARKTRALADLENIASGLERTEIDFAQYVRLFMLNDVRGGDGIEFDRPKLPGDIIDGVDDYLGGGYYQNHDQLFLDAGTGDLVTVAEGTILLDQLQDDETAFNFNGPYVNWQKDANSYTGDTQAEPDGIPDDPWGNNYLFFTRVGLVLEPDGDVVQQADFPIGGTTVMSGVDCERFDRATVMSLGPNGLPGDGVPGSELGTGDDIVRGFGQ